MEKLFQSISCGKFCESLVAVGSSQLNPNFRSLAVLIQVNRESEQTTKGCFPKVKIVTISLVRNGVVDDWISNSSKKASPVENDIQVRFK